MADMKSSNITENAKQQILFAVNDIASLAIAAKTLLIDATGGVGEDEFLSAKLMAGVIMAEKIGYLADLCNEKLSFSQHVGGAEDWMLSPAHQHYARQEAAETV